MDTAQARHARRNTLVDQHSYGVVRAELGLGTFETHLAAAAGSAVPRRGTAFDSGPGLAVRHWCAPLLGLEPQCTPAQYLARRRALGAHATTRTLLRGSGIGCFLLDTDARAAPEPFPDVHPLTAPAELAAAADAPAYEAGCLASLATQVAATSGSVRSFLGNTAAALHAAASRAAAFTVTARFLEAGPPDVREVQRAAGRWLRTREQAAAREQATQRRAPPGPGPGPGPEPGQATDIGYEPALLRHLLWSALTTGKPVQLRCPTDPARLAGFCAASRGTGADLVLLPRRPHHPAAARMAAAFPHVYAETGPSPEVALAQAPFAKLLFGTGTRSLPELYVVRARGFLRELDAVLARWVAERRCSRTDAARIADGVTGGTARRLYGLGEAAVTG